MLVHETLPHRPRKDQLMHDLHVERFTTEPGDGPIKTFTLRGLKDSPPYLHDGRCLTIEDTVEFAQRTIGDAWTDCMHPEIPETQVLENPYQYTEWGKVS